MATDPENLLSFVKYLFNSLGKSDWPDFPEVPELTDPQ